MAELVKSDLLMPSRRMFFLGVAAGAISASGAVERAQGQRGQFQVHTSPQTAGWQILPIGAGGYLTGLSMSNDGTVVIRTDTYGGYVWNPSALSPGGRTGDWQQIVNANSMPGRYQAISSGNGNGGGLWEIQVASSDSDILYMVYNDVTWVYPNKWTIYKSTNKGKTWSATGFTPINFHADLGAQFAGAKIPVKVWGPKLAIDPTNPDVVYVGSGQNGAFYTTNGGASWTNINHNAIPYATRYKSWEAIQVTRYQSGFMERPSSSSCLAMAMALI